MADVIMPRLSDSMEEGTIVRWLKSDGDEVKRGEEMVEIETDKATMTYEADQDGTLEVVAQEGDTLPIGEVIARIGSGSGTGGDAEAAAGDSDEEPEGEQPSGDGDDSGEDGDGRDDDARDEDEDEAAGAQDDDGAQEEDQADEAQDGKRREPVADRDGGSSNGSPEPGPSRERSSSATTSSGERLKASPVARRIAEDLGVRLEALSGSGPGGRIVKADVEQAAAENGHADGGEPERGDGSGADDGAPGRGDTQVEELSRTQQVIARCMAESKATIPDFTLQADVDMEAAVAARAQLKAVAGDRPTPSINDMIVKACALALREFPRANGSYRDGRFELHDRVNVGVAVASADALVVPTVFDADSKPLGRIAQETRELAGKVREGKVSPPELSGGTFTVSNLGMYGVTSFTAVINPPQAAILAVGTVEQRAVVRDGEVVARHTMSVTLVCDHRILYGAPAAAFLARVRELLENPAGLAL